MKEVTYEEWQKNPTPRMMWVWDDDIEEREKKKVVYVIKDDFAACPVLAVSEEDSSFCIYCHCAEIEKPKTIRMTNQELAWWLQEGKHREFKYVCGNVCVVQWFIIQWIILKMTVTVLLMKIFLSVKTMENGTCRLWR